MAGSDFKWYACKICSYINQSGKEAETFPEVGNIEMLIDPSRYCWSFGERYLGGTS